MTSFARNDALEFASPDDVRAAQEQLLRRHLEYCVEASPFYREQLAGLDLGAVSLEELPLTDKMAVSIRNSEFVAVDPEKVADIVFSSGTTGWPTKIMYTQGDLERLAYNEERAFNACGITSSDIVLLTCTMDRCFIAGLAYFLGARAVGAAAIRNGHGTMEGHGEVLKHASPTVIVGVPSFLRKLGEHLSAKGIDLPGSSVEKLVCIGEPLRDAAMAALSVATDLERIWGAKVYSTYASSETVTTFCECTEQAGGHLHPALGLVEILDEAGNEVPDGEPGEVVVTPLGVQGMPLVRYRTGDISFINLAPCACGRTSARLGPIIGRKLQLLKVQGTSLYPQSVFTALDEMPEVSEYYLEVLSDGPLSDRLVVHLAFSARPVEVDVVLRRLQARLRVKPEVIIEPMADIRRVVFTPESRKPVRFIDLRG
ncbi:Phenylacetate-coenzyme A ligase [Pontiella desulfatans]|uniref:Phenylacetate-coenzyme A ligase n=1 Tax=Pontiella desulfatans TaxID=2750659 RepID=A0A6C2TWH7_PONDE|nr:AMP-binding protein [Pontiella desulfatans]VGO12035.1 Phenylacetate-coenzyme A ligase [Pontiella desulfatans]